MKRCPQCEFLYEDEQRFCDMDGSKLSFDSRQLPRLQALTTAEVRAAKSFWRPHLVPAAAGLVLSTVLGLVYYVSVQQQNRPVPQPAPAAQTRQTLITPAVEEKVKPTVDAIEPTKTITAQPETVAENKPTPSETEAKSAETQKPERADMPATKKTRPVNLNSSQPRPVTPASTEAKPKKESKVSAVLKKTGRILKKPFKF
jgi:hypothetical protein